MSLRDELLQERLASYARLRGGYPIPLAGTVYWPVLGYLGTQLSPGRWTFWAFLLTGAIFPLALLFAKIFRNKFLSDRTAVSDLLFPAFISMLLFWPMAIAAWKANVQLVPLILAIGMSLHWPVIGWAYGRTGLYSAHSIVRAALCFLIWTYLPEARFTWLPASVGLVYLVTVIAIYVDSGRVARSARLNAAAASS